VSGISYLYHHIFKGVVGEYLHVEIQVSFDKYILVTIMEVTFCNNVLQCRKIHLLFLDRKRVTTQLNLLLCPLLFKFQKIKLPHPAFLQANVFFTPLCFTSYFQII